MPSDRAAQRIRFLLRTADVLDGFSDRMGRALSWLSLAMVIVTFLVVVLRYALDLGWIAMQESVTYMHASLFMLGATYALRHDGHVRVDIIYQKLSGRGRAWVDLLGTLLLLAPVCLFIVWVGWEYVIDSWTFLEGSREAGGIPLVYLLKTLIIVMPVLVLLQGTAIALHKGLFLAGFEGGGTTSATHRDLPPAAGGPGRAGSRPPDEGNAGDA